MAVNEVPAETIAALKVQLKPVTDKYVKQIGEPLVAQVQAEIAKVQGK